MIVHRNHPRAARGAFLSATRRRRDGCGAPPQRAVGTSDDTTDTGPRAVAAPPTGTSPLLALLPGAGHQRPRPAAQCQPDCSRAARRAGHQLEHLACPHSGWGAATPARGQRNPGPGWRLPGPPPAQHGAPAHVPVDAEDQRPLGHQSRGFFGHDRPSHQRSRRAQEQPGQANTTRRPIMAAAPPREHNAHNPPQGWRFCDRCGHCIRTSTADRAGRCNTCTQSREHMERELAAMRRNR